MEQLGDRAACAPTRVFQCLRSSFQYQGNKGGWDLNESGEVGIAFCLSRGGFADFPGARAKASFFLIRLLFPEARADASFFLIKVFPRSES